MHGKTLTHDVPLPDLGVIVTLRPARACDEYGAVALVSVPSGQERGEDGKPKMSAAQQVAYQMAVNDMLLLCQIVGMDGGEPPANLPAFLDEMTPDDMAVLRDGAEELKKN